MSRNTFVDPKFDLAAVAAALIDWAIYPVAAWDETGRVLAWNGRMAALTGWHGDELKGRTWGDVFCRDDEDRKAFSVLTKKVMGGKHPRETDVGLTLSLRDGTQTIVGCRPFPLVQGMGMEPIGVAATFRDLASVDHPIVVRAMDPSSGVMLDREMGTLVFRVDANTGRLIFVNELLAAFLGYQVADLIEDQRLMPSRVLPQYDEAFHSAMESAVRGVARSLEVGFVGAGGRDVFCVLTLSPLKGAIGNVVAVEGTGREVTSLKDAESRLEQSLGDLQAAYDTLRMQHEDLKSVERLKSQILANVSHELRTPLVTIRGYNDLMRQGALGDLSEGQRKGLEISARSIQRLLVLIENLLDYARIERRGLHPRRDIFDLVGILRSAIEDIREEAMRKGLQLEVSLPGEAVFVSCDGKRIKQVFFNLLDNAVKFSKTSGRVLVRCFRPNSEKVCVEVRDEGIGIAEKELRRIFDGFYQVDGSTTRPYPGAGIGLAVSREIVLRHKGRIDVQSTPQHGTSLLVTLPVLSNSNIESTGGQAPNVPEGDAPSDESRSSVQEKTGKDQGSQIVSQQNRQGGHQVPLDISKIDR